MAGSRRKKNRKTPTKKKNSKRPVKKSSTTKMKRPTKKSALLHSQLSTRVLQYDKSWNYGESFV
ncbi:CLUMA_CG005380, isoform A [Clunio marinus]|uniref:CLUMA_CG005380, isoform A n=1 Tax=Clunio marinus TaxID=568069 RepID=A0A1J1HW19_9DIPT|nr:CLUMA_CG005380, isoform A [Clunio marinus]